MSIFSNRFKKSESTLNSDSIETFNDNKENYDTSRTRAEMLTLISNFCEENGYIYYMSDITDTTTFLDVYDQNTYSLCTITINTFLLNEYTIKHEANKYISIIKEYFEKTSNDRHKKQAIVISAFPGCGKTYCYKNLQNNLKIIDSDSSNFSWIKDENGNNTKVRNPEFPNNYINHIKENINYTDIIFVSSHSEVRTALKENGIKSVLIFPEKDLYLKFMKRYRDRGNDDIFIDFISHNWSKFIDDMSNEDDKSFFKIRLNNSSFSCIDNRLLNLLVDKGIYEKYFNSRKG